MKMRIAAIVASLGLVLGVAGPAHADYGAGSVTVQEWDDVTKYMWKGVFEQNVANVTGTLHFVLPASGSQPELRSYYYDNAYSPDGGVAEVYFQTDGGGWKIYRSGYCKDKSSLGDFRDCTWRDWPIP